MGEGAGAADSLDQRQGVRGGSTFDELLDAAMGVEQSSLQVQHNLADRGESKVARLDNPGVDRPDRQVADPVALQGGERKRIA